MPKQKKKSGWVTLEGGTHIQLNKKGEITKGPDNFVGKNVQDLGKKQEKPKSKKGTVAKTKSAKSHAVSDTPSRPFSEYLKETPNVDEACQKFYKDEYLGRHVSARDASNAKIKVKMTSRGANKLRDIIKANPDCKAIVPLLPEILQTGKCLGAPLLPFKERSDYSGFLYFYKKVQTPDGPRHAVVDVGIVTSKGAPYYEQYNFSTPDRRDWPEKQKALERAYGKFVADASTSARSAFLSQQGRSPVGARVSTSNGDNFACNAEFVNITILSAEPRDLKAMLAERLAQAFIALARRSARRRAA